MIRLIGAAIDACASTRGAADTPSILETKYQNKFNFKFDTIHTYDGVRNDLPHLQKYFTNLAHDCLDSLDNQQFPVVIGGDHSSAIGTWSGIVEHYKKLNQTIGLIWVDAHMDAHSPETTITGNIHGMPVAVLLGEGYPELTSIMNQYPKIKPENIIQIGIRSYEDAERERLERLGVKIYYTEEVQKRGIQVILQEAWNILKAKVDQIGFSIDLDGFDPEFAPGVGTLEPNGVHFPEFIKIFKSFNLNEIAGLEITEGNDHFDPSGKTMHCVIELLHSLIKDDK